MSGVRWRVVCPSCAQMFNHMPWCTAAPAPVGSRDAGTNRDESAWRPCPSVARAILGAVDAPDGVLLRCGLAEGHETRHAFHMEWADPNPHGGRLITDDIAAYLASRREDPDFRRRLAERMKRDAEILRRLADDDGPEAQA